MLSEKFCFSEPTVVSIKDSDAAEDKMFSFSSPAAECESGEYTETAGDSEVGYETDDLSSRMRRRLTRW